MTGREGGADDREDREAREAAQAGAEATAGSEDETPTATAGEDEGEPAVPPGLVVENYPSCSSYIQIATKAHAVRPHHLTTSPPHHLITTSPPRDLTHSLSLAGGNVR